MTARQTEGGQSLESCLHTLQSVLVVGKGYSQANVCEQIDLCVDHDALYMK